MSTCRFCGTEIVREGRGRPGSVCETCRNVSCEWCARGFRSKLIRGQLQRWCSQACRGAQRTAETRVPNRVCWGCQRPFWSGTSRNGSGRPDQRWCSVSCRWEHIAQLRVNRARFRDHLARVDKALRRDIPRHIEVLAPRVCRRCSATFTPTTHNNIYCSDACNWRSQRSRRRARTKDAYVEDVELADIYARDGGICQLCFTRVDRRCKHPHPKTPVPDHIVPLARGGTHERRNVQLAHHGCNSKKNARSAGSQLRMFG